MCNFEPMFDSQVCKREKKPKQFASLIWANPSDLFTHTFNILMSENITFIFLHIYNSSLSFFSQICDFNIYF